MSDELVELRTIVGDLNALKSESIDLEDKRHIVWISILIFFWSAKEIDYLLLTHLGEIRNIDNNLSSRRHLNFPVGGIWAVSHS